MTARELLKVLRGHGCVELRQKGSHVFVKCGNCTTVVPVHGGDIPVGTFASIKRDLKPCLGDGWWQE